ncbi:hypothetical protein MMC17_007337 [Xylographa soralifera]|nr:hypothetical protein [Xylographa soralifera]
MRFAHLIPSVRVRAWLTVGLIVLVGLLGAFAFAPSPSTHSSAPSTATIDTPAPHSTAGTPALVSASTVPAHPRESFHVIFLRDGVKHVETYDGSDVHAVMDAVREWWNRD